MARLWKEVIVLVAVVVLTATLATRSPAQTVISYYSQPVVSYYAPPAYYTPAPVVSYYSPPAVSYYAPTVSYYAPPAVSYYAPPAVAPATTVATYRGILPWRTYTVASYGGAPLVVAPTVRYYRPFFYYP